MPSYLWPALGITVADMQLLFPARRLRQPRVLEVYDRIHIPA